MSLPTKCTLAEHFGEKDVLTNEVAVAQPVSAVPDPAAVGAAQMVTVTAAASIDTIADIVITDAKIIFFISIPLAVY